MLSPYEAEPHFCVGDSLPVQGNPALFVGNGAFLSHIWGGDTHKLLCLILYCRIVLQISVFLLALVCVIAAPQTLCIVIYDEANKPCLSSTVTPRTPSPVRSRLLSPASSNHPTTRSRPGQSYFLSRQIYFFVVVVALSRRRDNPAPHHGRHPALASHMTVRIPKTIYNRLCYRDRSQNKPLQIGIKYQILAEPRK